MDEDAQIFVRAQHKTTISPWRLFERYLLEYEPAVGTPHYTPYPPTKEVSHFSNYIFSVEKI